MDLELKNLRFILIILIMITLLSAMLTYFGLSDGTGKMFNLFLALSKLVILALFFMELRFAHRFWIFLLTVIAFFALLGMFSFL